MYTDSKYGDPLKEKEIQVLSYDENKLLTIINYVENLDLLIIIKRVNFSGFGCITFTLMNIHFYIKIYPTQFY